MAGEYYRVIKLIQDTIVGTDDSGELVKAPGTVALFDPTSYLADVAETAWRWYGLIRTTIDFQTGFISDDLDVGELIISIEDGLAITIGAGSTNVTETTQSFNVDDPVLIYTDGGTMPAVNGFALNSNVLYVVSKAGNILELSEIAGGTAITFDTAGSNLFLTLASVNTPVTSKTISFPAELSHSPQLNSKATVSYQTGYAEIEFIE